MKTAYLTRKIIAPWLQIRVKNPALLNPGEVWLAKDFRLGVSYDPELGNMLRLLV